MLEVGIMIFIKPTIFFPMIFCGYLMGSIRKKNLTIFILCKDLGAAFIKIKSLLHLWGPCSNKACPLMLYPTLKIGAIVPTFKTLTNYEL
jgi:hypothetical protein